MTTTPGEIVLPTGPLPAAGTAGRLQLDDNKVFNYDDGTKWNLAGTVGGVLGFTGTQAIPNATDTQLTGWSTAASSTHLPTGITIWDDTNKQFVLPYTALYLVTLNVEYSSNPMTNANVRYNNSSTNRVAFLESASNHQSIAGIFWGTAGDTIQAYTYISASGVSVSSPLNETRFGLVCLGGR